MSQSDDESSDSSCDFLVAPDKINLNSSFFQENSTSNSNSKSAQNTLESSDSDEEELEEDFDSGNVDNAELFSQILKNLESTKSIRNVKEQESSSQEQTKDEVKDETGKSDGLANEIDQLLLQGESAAALSNFVAEKQADVKEEEEEDKSLKTSSKYTIPKEGVLVTLPGTNIYQDRKEKKKQDLQALLRNKINQRIRTTQVLIHKVGLLWWLVYGFHLNRLASESETLATCLSLISKNDYPKARVDLVYLQRVTKWFHKTFPFHSKQEHKVLTTDSLLERIGEKQIYDYRELVILFAALLRAIGLKCRLVVSLCPPPLKPKREQLFQINKDEDEDKDKNTQEKKSEKSKEKTKKGTTGKTKTSTKKQTKQKDTKNVTLDNSPEGRKKAQIEARKKAADVLKKEKENKSKVKDSNSKSSLKSTKNKSSSTVKKVAESKEENSKEESKIARKLRQRVKKTPVPLDVETDEEEEDFDDDYTFVPSQPKKESKELKTPEKDRKVLSSDDESQMGNKAGENVWVEVYVESENNWIPVSITTGKVNCAKEIYKKAPEPVLYVVAYNSEGTIKDVTRRYCPHWLTVTRKQRVDENWWKESMNPWKEADSVLSKAEDELLLKRELEQPLPKTVSECKGHPLYALVRHLLKFEALYPPDAVPLGYLKNGEAIYSRHCVHTLRSRETWVKQARVVKPAQEAYKVVTSMPKYDKFTGSRIKGLPLDLFGKWQTTPYVPPEAKDGIVPRNDYGNVDLFKMCMLPKGTVYINLPALNRVARKLNIDCAPAVVGFNFKKVGAVPAFEGFVVCEEFEDTLRDAWEKEQVEAAKRATEKRDKRIYGNWRKLINGLLIRVKLAKKYTRDDNNQESDSDPESFADIRKQLQAKRKKATLNKETENEMPTTSKQILKKEDEEPSEEVPERKTRKSVLKKPKLCEETANTSTRQKQKVVRKKVDDEDSDSDFEVKRPKIVRKKVVDEDSDSDFEVKKQKNVRKKVVDEDSDSDFEVKRPRRVTRSRKT